MVSWVSIKENLITVGFFTGILFPLRMLFYSYLSSYWIGSFGIITAVTLTLLYLAKKGKLGKFGNIIIRRFYKRAKGKSGIGAIIFSSVIIYLSLLVIISCTYASHNEITLVKSTLKDGGINSIHDFISKPLPQASWEEYIAAEFIVLTPNPLGAAIWKTVNQMTNGWILSILTVEVIEVIEALGLTLYLRYTKVLEIGK